MAYVSHKISFTSFTKHLTRKELGVSLSSENQSRIRSPWNNIPHDFQRKNEYVGNVNFQLAAVKEAIESLTNVVQKMRRK